MSGAAARMAATAGSLGSATTRKVSAMRSEDSGASRAETPSWQEHVATQFAAGPLFLGDLRKQSDSDSQHIKDWITRYVQLRKSVPITDSFFPLGSWRQPRADAWDGFARLARSGESR